MILVLRVVCVCVTDVVRWWVWVVCVCKWFVFVYGLCKYVCVTGVYWFVCVHVCK